MEIKCPDCNNYIDASSKFCPKCGRTMSASASPVKTTSRVACPDGNCTGAIGTNGKCNYCGKDKDWEQSPGTKECPFCSETIKMNAVKCKHCGEYLDISRKTAAVSRSRGSRNKTVAALLAIFLGGTGIHKFYLGRTGQGIFYIFLAFFAYISGLLGLIDGIILLCMDQAAFDAKFN